MRTIAIWILLARTALACAPAPPPGERVAIAEETALIVWDGAREHFIRRATFDTTSTSFGFLVPTPTKPELAEVDDRVFDELDIATRPAIVIDDSYDGVELTTALLFFLGKRAAPTAAAVRVVEEKHVAGYDAVILAADEPAALADWLRSHGYATRPALADWLAPYVSKKWMLTAFKVAGARSTSAVRMSFATEHPFFPYREPTDQPKGGERLLRVYFVGPTRVDGTLGSSTWPGDTTSANRFAGSLPVATPQGAWLTTFDDRSSPRPGTDDVVFVPSENKPFVPAAVTYPRHRKVPIPLDAIALVVVMSVLVLALRRRSVR